MVKTATVNDHALRRERESRKKWRATAQVLRSVSQHVADWPRSTASLLLGNASLSLGIAFSRSTSMPLLRFLRSAGEVSSVGPPAWAGGQQAGAVSSVGPATEQTSGPV